MRVDDLRTAGRMGFDLATDLWRSIRFWGLIPVLILFTLGAAWGLSDANVAGIDTSTPMSVLYLTSALILLAGTLGIVVAGFDSISVPRANGQLVMELAQPVPRWVLALGRLIGVWMTVALPTILLCIGAIFIVRLRADGWVELADGLIFLVATMLLLIWYSAIQLVASSLAKDGGSALALGIGTWVLFTTLWILVSLVVAGLFGLNPTDAGDERWVEISAIVDLFSPNGTYQLLLQSRLDGGNNIPIPTPYVWLSAIAWTIVPVSILFHRFRNLRP